MKQIITYTTPKIIMLLMTLACLTASCAKKYGCYYSAVPVICPTPEILKPTGAQAEPSPIPLPGEFCPDATGMPAGLH